MLRIAFGIRGGRSACALLRYSPSELCAIKQASKEYEALLHELTADAEDSLMAADSVADLDERILNAESLMLRTVGFSIWQAHESELESAEDFERVHIAIP